MARGLFEMGVWLHPDESKALFEALDEDDGGTVDSQEFCAFWEKYGTYFSIAESTLQLRQSLCLSCNLTSKRSQVLTRGRMTTMNLNFEW